MVAGLGSAVVVGGDGVARVLRIRPDHSLLAPRLKLFVATAPTAEIGSHMPAESVIDQTEERRRIAFHDVAYLGILRTSGPWLLMMFFSSQGLSTISKQCITPILL